MEKFKIKNRFIFAGIFFELLSEFFILKRKARLSLTSYFINLPENII
jgi:hypothetical protein